MAINPNPNYASAYGAIVVDGKTIIPYNSFRDLSIAKILWVRFVVGIKTNTGALTNAFQINYVQPKELTLEQIYVPVIAGLTTIQQFQQGLQTINNFNTFTVYTGLKYTSLQPSNMFVGQTADQLTVLVNDAEADSQYLPSINQTVITIDVANWQDRYQMYFTGKQNKSGNYYYFQQAGNSLSI